MSTRNFDLLPLILLAAFLPSGSARAYCIGTSSGPWNGSVPVQINNNLDDVACPGSSCTFDELMWTTRAQMDEIYDNSGANIRFAYDGTTAVAPGSWIAGKLHIFGSSGTCGDGFMVAAWEDSNADGFTDRAKIRVCSDYLGDPIQWNAYPDSSAGFAPPWSLSYSGFMTEELLHTLNMDHPWEWFCGFQTVFSAVGITSDISHKGHHVYKDDIQGLQAQYGLRTRTGQARRSSDGITWVAGATAPAALNTGVLSRISTCSSPSSAPFFSYAGASIPAGVTWGQYTSGAWTIGGSISSTSYFTGTACINNASMLIAYLSSYVDTTGLQHVYSATTTNSGTNWAYSTEASNATTNAGVQAAYDPVSGNYVMAWRGSTDRIVTKVKLAGAVPVEFETAPGSGAYYRSADAPTISCGPASVGAENCIIAWADTGWIRTLRWAHAHVDTTSKQLVLSSVISQGWIALSSPSVSYWGGASYPWQIAFHQGGNTAYTFRKGNTTTASWQDQRSQASGSKIVSPLLGSARSLAHSLLFYVSSP